MIVNITDSPKQGKRFRVYMDNGRHFDFGLDTGNTYIDHKDTTKRANYWARHLGNNTEKKLISNLIPSPSLFSAMLLWGKYTDINQNILNLNNRWLYKHLRG
jgi:hypothetical protein